MSRSKSEDNGNAALTRNIIAVFAVIAVIGIIIACVLFVPRLSGGSQGSGSTASPTAGSDKSGADSSVVKGFPDDAAKSALDWYVGVTKKLDDSELPKDFFASNESTDILNKFAEGDYSKMPKDVQSSLYFSDDAQKLEGRLVDYPTLKASALTGIIMGWQLYNRALESDGSFKPSTDGVMVDKDHGQVVFPMESICGMPATVTVALDWDGQGWKIDGDILGSQVASQVRSNQLQASMDKSEAKDDK